MFLICRNQQVKKGIPIQKLFWPLTVQTKFPIDFKKFENSQPSASNFQKFFLWSLKQWNCWHLISNNQLYKDKLIFLNYFYCQSLKLRIHQWPTFMLPTTCSWQIDENPIKRYPSRRLIADQGKNLGGRPMTA